MTMGRHNRLGKLGTAKFQENWRPLILRRPLILTAIERLNPTEVDPKKEKKKTTKYYIRLKIFRFKTYPLLSLEEQHIK